MSTGQSKLQTEWGRGFMFATKIFVALIIVAIGAYVGLSPRGDQSNDGGHCFLEQIIQGPHLYFLISWSVAASFTMLFIYAMRCIAKADRCDDNAIVSSIAMAVVFGIAFAVTLIYSLSVTWHLFEKFIT